MIPSSFNKHSKPIIISLITIFLCLFAYRLTIETGSRGFLAIDQSTIFDGSYRVASGQIPFKDFVFAHGLITFYLTAIFFKILGVNYYSFILSAAIVNVLAVLCSILLIKILFKKTFLTPYVTGFITAIWFYPPNGTPWSDQTSFLFSMVGIYILIFGVLTKRFYLIFIAGIFAFISFLSKQSAGVFFLPIYFIIIAFYNEINRVKRIKLSFIFMLGFCFSVIFFISVCYKYADLKLLFDHFLLIPLEAGRVSEGWIKFIKSFMWAGQFTLLPRMVIIISLITPCYIVYSYLRNMTKTNYLIKDVIASILAIYLAIFQYFFIYTTHNSPANAFPFIGIIFGIGVMTTLRILNESKFRPLINNQIFNKTVVSIITIFFIYINLQGISISMLRKVQGGFPDHPKHFKTFTENKLKHLKWISPTHLFDPEKGMTNWEIKKEDFENLFLYLKKKDKNFFIFPDNTIFYGLLNKPSPQPILWFDKGLTYRNDYELNIDNWIVEKLITNHIQTVVIEKHSFFGTYERLNDFPIMKKYIYQNFKKNKEIGIFDIYVKV